MSKYQFSMTIHMTLVNTVHLHNSHCTYTLNYYSIITVPAPIVNVTTMDDMVFGESLQLDCTVTAARGITTNASIQWFAINNLLGSTRLVRFVTVAGNISNDSVVFEDSLFIPSLNADDSFSDYRCDVFIFSPIQLVSGSGRIELDFQGEYLYMCVCDTRTKAWHCTPSNVSVTHVQTG